MVRELKLVVRKRTGEVVNLAPPDAATAIKLLAEEPNLEVAVLSLFEDGKLLSCETIAGKDVVRK